MPDENAISLKDLKEQIKALPNNTTLLVDVRTPHEHQTLRIEGSVNIPIGELRDRLDELNGYETIITICAHGVRSKKAADILAELPCKILYVNGNIEEWIATGLPVVRGAEL